MRALLPGYHAWLSLQRYSMAVMKHGQAGNEQPKVVSNGMVPTEVQYAATVGRSLRLSQPTLRYQVLGGKEVA
jgi:hypothetical protein